LFSLAFPLAFFSAEERQDAGQVSMHIRVRPDQSPQKCSSANLAMAVQRRRPMRVQRRLSTRVQRRSTQPSRCRPT
jgi:hypothetical protein